MKKRVGHTRSVIDWTLPVMIAILTGGCDANDGREHDAPEPAAVVVAGHEDHSTHDHGQDEEEHGGDRGHREHDEGVRLSREVMDEFGVDVAEAGPGELESDLSLPGEVVVNPDQVVHVVPRVPGIAEKVNKTIGDVTHGGEVLAVIESAQLANAKATYLASKQRLSLAQANIAANEELRSEGIVSELEVLAARRELAEAEIKQRTAEFTLHALGLTEEDLPKLEEKDGTSFATFEVRAPFAGTIIDRHISLGEVVTPESEIFVLADLSTVWVHLTVYQKDLAYVRPGQAVVISFGHDIPDAQGVIDYVSPTVEEKTRTATARVVLKNPQGIWRPGLFVDARVQVSKTQVPIRVPMTALITMEAETVVFVEAEDGFRPQHVTIGRSNRTHVEIINGLQRGQRYVTKNAITLKAEMGKGSMGGHQH